MSNNFKINMPNSAGNQSEAKFKWGSLLLWLGVLGIVFLIIFGLYKSSNNNNSSSVIKDDRAATVLPTDHVTGNLDSKIVVVEYADFQCPACAAFYSVLKQLKSEFGGSAKFVYRNFPLSAIHPNARPAAYAAGAAALQNKFWEMHDLLYENQAKWASMASPNSEFTKYANSIGLDVNKWQADMKSKVVKDKVDADYSSGVAIGVNGTPTVFVDGVMVQSSYDAIKSAILKQTDAPKTQN